MTETLCLSTSETTERAFEIKAGDTPGTFEGYGAVFGNKDQDGDIISPGAFSMSLTARKPALLWQHDKKQPIGVFEEVREDARGLYVRGRLSMEGKGREAYDLLKLGALNGLSIGFVTREAGRNSMKGARVITKADLMEVSLVTFPANDLARVSTVKAAGDIEDPRSFERFLRDSGFSRNRAKAITAKGFKSADMSAGESAEIAAMVYELKNRRNDLNTKGMGSKVEMVLPPSIWTRWREFPYFTPTEPTSFNIRVQSIMPGRTRHPIQLQVKYNGKEFLWQSNGNPAMGMKYPLVVGAANVIKVRGRALGLFAQRVIVSLVEV